VLSDERRALRCDRRAGRYLWVRPGLPPARDVAAGQLAGLGDHAAEEPAIAAAAPNILINYSSPVLIPAAHVSTGTAVLNDVRPDRSGGMVAA